MGDGKGLVLGEEVVPNEAEGRTDGVEAATGTGQSESVGTSSIQRCVSSQPQLPVLLCEKLMTIQYPLTRWVSVVCRVPGLRSGEQGTVPSGHPLPITPPPPYTCLNAGQGRRHRPRGGHVGSV